MVHRQYRIKPLESARSEETIRGIRAEGKYPFFICPGDGRPYYILFLMAKQTVVTGMRVKAQHTYPRAPDCKVLQQRPVQQSELGQDISDGDCARDILQGHVLGDKTYLHALGDHEHQHIVGAGL